MTRKLFTDEELQRLRKLFQEMDVERNSDITSDQARQCLVNFGFHLTDEQFNGLIDKYDTNKSGTVEFVEFMKMCNFCKEIQIREAEEAAQKKKEKDIVEKEKLKKKAGLFGVSQYQSNKNSQYQQYGIENIKEKSKENERPKEKEGYQRYKQHGIEKGKEKEREEEEMLREKGREKWGKTQAAVSRDEGEEEATTSIIADIAVNNLAYASTDFLHEFEEIFGRKANTREMALFLRHQRVAQERERERGREGEKGKEREGGGRREREDEESQREFSGYVFKECIGGGAFGKVYKAQHKVTKAVRAIKVISINRGKEESSRKSDIDGEAKIGTEFGKRCLFLVDYEQVTVLRGELVILMEYCSAGDLRQLLDRRVQTQTPFQEEEILHFLVEVGLAVQTLHTANVVHRDIKPQNIFLTAKGLYKLGDYGTARFVSADGTMSMVGTSGYMAPEILQGDLHYVAAVDIYSLGCILFEMMELKHPFKNEKGNLNIVNVSMGKHIPFKNTHFTPMLVALVERMISVDSSSRPSIAEVLATLPVVSFLATFYTAVKKKEHEEPE